MSALHAIALPPEVSICDTAFSAPVAEWRIVDTNICTLSPKVLSNLAADTPASTGDKDCFTIKFCHYNFSRV